MQRASHPKGEVSFWAFRELQTLEGVKNARRGAISVVNLPTLNFGGSWACIPCSTLVGQLEKSSDWWTYSGPLPSCCSCVSPRQSQRSLQSAIGTGFWKCYLRTVSFSQSQDFLGEGNTGSCESQTSRSKSYTFPEDPRLAPALSVRVRLAVLVV